MNNLQFFSFFQIQCDHPTDQIQQQQKKTLWENNNRCNYKMRIKSQNCLKTESIE